MRTGIIIICFWALVGCGGCGTSQPPVPIERQAPRTSDRLLRKYAEPEIARRYGDADAKVRVERVKRDGDRLVADATIESDGQKVRRRYVLDSKGRVVEELR